MQQLIITDAMKHGGVMADKNLKKCIDFGHYTIVKHSENNFVVMYNEEEITSADSFASACQKTTLLEIGFKHGEECHDQ